MAEGFIAPYNRFPIVWVGPRSPVGRLCSNFPAAVETPDIQHIGISEFTALRTYGAPQGELTPDWGINDESIVFDDFDKHDAPESASERVRAFDVQRCFDIDEALVIPTGVTFEIIHQHSLESGIGILERLPIVFEVDALDDAGIPIFTYGQLNGERPCIDALVHPNPAVGALTWQYRLTMSAQTGVGRSGLAYIGPATPSAVRGNDRLSPWSDLRYGHLDQAPGFAQVLIANQSVLRLWVTFFGPTDRYRIRIGARMSGFLQLAGRRGSAIEAATTRLQ